MKRSRPAIFRGRHFEPEIIATCVRWYLRFSLSLRDVEEMMAERGLLVDPTRLSGAGVKSTRLSHDLQDPKDLVQCDRQLFGRLKALDSNELLKKTKDYLTKLEAEAVMARD